LRHHLSSGRELWQLEGQQQMLRVFSGGIHSCVHEALAAYIGRLGYRYCRTKNPELRAEIARLEAELAKLPARWEFREQ
jgi:hypothetical protein